MRIPPPAWAWLALCTQALIARGQRGTRGSTTAAIVLGTSAIGLGVSAVGAFRRAKTTISPEDVDAASSLVEAGPFRFTRNPMYSAIVGALFAHALYRDSLRACLPVVAFVAVIDRTQIPREEAALHERFGGAYDDYRNRVPRW